MVFLGRALALLVVALWLWPTGLHAQSDELIAAYRQGNALREAGRYEQAILYYRKVVELAEREFGPDHPTTATLLINLAVLYDDQGRYADAEPLYKRSLAIDEKTLGPDHSDVATALNNLAEHYRVQGRHADAEPLYKRSLAIWEKALGPDDPNVATALNNLAALYQGQGRYAEAEPLFKRSLAIDEKALGPDHRSVATTLNNLAGLYQTQGRIAEAEPLYERALAIREEVLGPDHADVGQSLNNLALLYRDQGRYAEAEPLYKRSLAIKEEVLGPDHPSLATTLNNLALLYREQGRYGDAEPLYKRSLAIWEKALGPGHPYVATTLNNLAGLYKSQGRYADAEPLYKRSLAIWEKALGPDHPNVATALNNLAVLYDDQGRYADALVHIRRSSAIHRARASRAGAARSTGALSEQTSVRYVFLHHVDVATRAIEREPERREEYVAEAFEAGQLAQATGAAAAVARMGARFAAGDDALARTVRARQDAVEQWQRMDARLVKAVGEPPAKRDAKTEAALRSEFETLDDRIDRLDALLSRDFPGYADLANPKPHSLAGVQSLLDPAEALMVYLVSDDVTFLWVVRRDRATFHRLDIGREELDGAVARLRAGLDPTGIRRLADVTVFDTTLAFELYSKLFAPAEPLLEGARHVFVVPDAGLQSLPLGVLVTEQPQEDIADFSDYRRVPWLARKKYAMTVLPAVSSLRALRGYPRASSASRPFIGFGDPAVGGTAGTRRLAAGTLFSGGAMVGTDVIRGLDPLPETAVELYAIAKTLGAKPNDTVFLRRDATETRVRHMDLSDFEVVAFATHGLVAGQFKRLGEPGLVLTPPSEASEADDGFLAASEIAQLKLNADWVILSACNTAAPDGTPGAEGLSGLAKAFFYAGARALLVSHWEVRSDAAVRLTTRMLAEAAEHPDIGRAEALKRSMLALMDDPENEHFAHPMFWAPFVVVGEGGIPQR